MILNKVLDFRIRTSNSENYGYLISWLNFSGFEGESRFGKYLINPHSSLYKILYEFFSSYLFQSSLTLKRVIKTICDFIQMLPGTIFYYPSHLSNQLCVIQWFKPGIGLNQSTK